MRLQPPSHAAAASVACGCSLRRVLLQAESLGSLFRNSLFPAEGGGFLRLHSTYRHDLKIYSSDEGRVQMTAAAFARGFLDLEGFLTPILASLVSKDKVRTRPACSPARHGLQPGTVQPSVPALTLLASADGAGGTHRAAT